MSNIGTGTSGTILQAQGAGVSPKYTTATFPATATSTNTLLRANGTNWVASTETWAVPGTSGNVLTSDGTNWTSAAAAGSSTSYALNQAGSGAFVNPADATTYYVIPNTSWVTTFAASVPGRLTIPKTGSIKAAYGFINVAGTLGSNENVTVAIRLNDTTNTNITSTLQMTAIVSTFSNAALNISVTAGDVITFQVITPTWGTNPTNVIFNCTFFVS